MSKQESVSLRKMLVDAMAGHESHLDFESAVKEFPADLRGRKPPGAPHSAWELLEHMRIAQRDILKFSQNPRHQSPKWPEGYWPTAEAPPDSSAWDRSVALFEADARELDALVRDPENDLFKAFEHGSGQTLAPRGLTGSYAQFLPPRATESSSRRCCLRAHKAAAKLMLMHGLFSQARPSFDQVLLVESGDRQVTEKVLSRLYEIGQARCVDVLTCYSATPNSFDPQRGVIHSIHGREASRGRLGFIRKLLAAPYTAVAMLSTDSPVMRNWKWAIALLTKSPILIIDQEGDFLCLGFRGRAARLISSRPIRVLLAEYLRLAAELLLIPLMVTYLLLYAGAVHGRRLFRAK